MKVARMRTGGFFSVIYKPIFAQSEVIFFWTDKSRYRYYSEVMPNVADRNLSYD